MVETDQLGSQETEENVMKKKEIGQGSREMKVGMIWEQPEKVLSGRNWERIWDEAWSEMDSRSQFSFSYSGKEIADYS